MANIDLSNLFDEVNKELTEYSKNFSAELKAEVKDAAKICEEEIKNKSPKRTGAYSKGWRATVIYENPCKIVVAIHNRDRYQLTHLLENGHDGGFGGKPVKAIPHIADAEKEASDRLLKRVTMSVGGKW